MLIKALVLAVIFYLGICAFMFFRQERLLFPSHLAPSSSKKPTETFKTQDGETLETHIFEASTQNAPVVILFTGNAQNALVTGKTIFEGFADKAHVATMNYRSYGNSTGHPTEENILTDALAFSKSIQTKYPDRSIYIMGISLGTGASTYVASKLHVKGVILMTPYDSIINVASDAYPFLPVKFLLGHKFDSFKFIQNVKAPVAIIRAGEDEVIPAKRTENFSKHVPNLVYDKVLKGMAHTQILNPPYKKSLQAVLLETLNALPHKFISK